MENKASDDLLNLFLNIFLDDEQEVDSQLSNSSDVVELPDNVVKDILEDHEADYWVSHNKDNPIE